MAGRLRTIPSHASSLLIVAVAKKVAKKPVKKGAKVAARAENPITSRIDRAIKATFSEENWAYQAITLLAGLPSANAKK